MLPLIPLIWLVVGRIYKKIIKHSKVFIFPLLLFAIIEIYILFNYFSFDNFLHLPIKAIMDNDPHPESIFLESKYIIPAYSFSHMTNNKDRPELVFQ